MLSTDNPSRLIDVARSAVADLRGGDLYGLRVSLDSTLQRDLGLDSLARVELLHRTEEAFKIRLPDEAFASAATLRDLLAAIERAGPQATSVLAATAEIRGAISTESAPDTAATLIEVLRWHVERRPSAAGITLLGVGGEQPITHEKLWETALALCGALQSRGIVAGEAIALMLPTGAEYFTAFIGVLLCGCVPVPIYPPAEAAQLEEHIRRYAKLLANARVVALLTDRSVHRLGRLLQANVPCLRRVETAALLIGEGILGKVAPAAGNSLALLQYTSGSTGDPKGVMLTHAQLLANIRAMGRAVHIQSCGHSRQLVAALSRYGSHRGLVWHALLRHPAARDVTVKLYRAQSAGYGRSTNTAQRCRRRLTLPMSCASGAFEMPISRDWI